MMKRMTMLAQKEGMATSDFRAYWAGPHAKLALGMEGINRYTQNRVDKVLWASGDEAAFDVDGIVELSFSDDNAMRSAQASTVGTKFIPADEPLFLRGWTLCMVDVQGEEPTEPWVKVLIPFRAQAEVRETFWSELQRVAAAAGTKVSLNWTVSTAKREQLWAEPAPPTGFISLWFGSVSKAHEAFEPASDILKVVERYADDGVAYLIDQLRIK